MKTPLLYLILCLVVLLAGCKNDDKLPADIVPSTENVRITGGTPTFEPGAEVTLQGTVFKDGDKVKLLSPEEQIYQIAPPPLKIDQNSLIFLLPEECEEGDFAVWILRVDDEYLVGSISIVYPEVADSYELYGMDTRNGRSFIYKVDPYNFQILDKHVVDGPVVGIVRDRFIYTATLDGVISYYSFDDRKIYPIANIHMDEYEIILGHNILN